MDSGSSEEQDCVDNEMARLMAELEEARAEIERWRQSAATGESAGWAEAERLRQKIERLRQSVAVALRDLERDTLQAASKRMLCRARERSIMRCLLAFAGTPLKRRALLL